MPLVDSAATLIARPWWCSSSYFLLVLMRRVVTSDCGESIEGWNGNRCGANSTSLAVVGIVEGVTYFLKRLISKLNE